MQFNLEKVGDTRTTNAPSVTQNKYPAPQNVLLCCIELRFIRSNLEKVGDSSTTNVPIGTPNRYPASHNVSDSFTLTNDCKDGWTLADFVF